MDCFSFETGPQEGDLLSSLGALTLASVDCQTISFRQGCRFCDYPRRVTVVTVEDECVVGIGNEPRVSFLQLLMDRFCPTQYSSILRGSPCGTPHGTESRCAACRSWRKASVWFLRMRGTLAWSRPRRISSRGMLLKAFVMSSETACVSSICISVYAMRTLPMCRQAEYIYSVSRKASLWSPGDSGLSCGAPLRSSTNCVCPVSSLGRTRQNSYKARYPLLSAAPRISLKACARASGTPCTWVRTR
ncbi:Hypothetical protein GLP15_3287 [Giardia lamblia P15]|uniref:Uncharacterized protein n=1 Tax=Giardia intestinalis (strain P15) TaxID=658858 RepID=E1F990_GIAIA|nr:Hypothetical protein GLP15_3287 [Giardia lamblia P15]